MFNKWLAEAKPGEKFCYFRGELAYAKQFDPHLARFADKLLELSTGRFDQVSACGHVRGEIIGDGTVELITRRDRGETVYLARKRPPTAGS